jgi:hypothetical protein
LAKKALQNRRRSTAGRSMAALVYSEELSKSTIELASDAVTTEEQATALFADFIRRVRAQPGIKVGRDEFAKSKFDTFDWPLAQQQVRRLLPQIADYATLSISQKARLMSEVNEGLILEGEVTPLATLDGLAVHVRNGSMVGAASLGLLPLVLPDGWAYRLGKCRLEDCGKYFLRDAGKRGRQGSFCTSKHAVLMHVRAFRERNKEG